MIPPVNEIGLAERTFPGHGDSFRGADGYGTVKFQCDCCARFWWAHHSFEWPKVVEVKGVKYYGCPSADGWHSHCAEILFNIHHQYAMREA